MTHTNKSIDDTVNCSRRRFFGLVASGVAAAAMTSVMTMDAEASGRIATMIRHPETGNWVEYTPRRAAKYYRAHGQVPAEFRRQVVDFKTREKPGTIIVDGNKHFLFFVMGNGKAMRYGIGVGRNGFGWAGIVKVGRTAKWPTWTPPAEMVARDKNAAKWAHGMPGGPKNPLGSRALYLYEGGRDTIYRIHGTNKPWTIGLNCSSGCVRMNNDDIADLHERVSVGAKVIVLMQNVSTYKGV